MSEQKKSNATDAGAPGGRYYLTITDPKNPMAKGNLTITIEVKDNALEGLTASDDQDNKYEVSLHIKKVGAKSSRRPAPDDGVEDTSNVAGPTVDTTAVTLTDTTPAGAAPAAGGASPGTPPPHGKPHPPPGGGGDEDEDDDDDEDDDECQCCRLIAGQLACEECPCV